MNKLGVENMKGLGVIKAERFGRLKELKGLRG